jgi:hypothetical protein
MPAACTQRWIVSLTLFFSFACGPGDGTPASDTVTTRGSGEAPTYELGPERTMIAKAVAVMLPVPSGIEHPARFIVNEACTPEARDLCKTYATACHARLAPTAVISAGCSGRPPLSAPA